MTGRLLLVVAALSCAGCGRLLALAVGAAAVEPSALDGPLEDAQIIDLRSRADYEAGHIGRAVHVPLLALNGYLHRAPRAGDRPLVLVSETSVDALLLAPTARLHGYSKTSALAGGMARWRALGLPVQRGATAPEPSAKPPRVELTREQQIVSFLSGGVVKPTYMLLSLLLILWLRRATSTPLRLLRHGLLWFLVGEALCLANFFLHQPGHVYFIEVLHGVGMVAMSTLIPWGLFRLLDERVLQFGDPEQRCAVQRLCGQCWKRDRAVGCGPHDLMVLLLVALAGIALMPLTSDLRPTMFATTVFDHPADYGEPIINHLVELRAYPVLGAALLLLTALLMRGGPRSVRRAEPLFFIGFGFAAYPLLRHLLANAYREALWWSDLWEELTELAMILAIGMLLISLRRQLLPRQLRPDPRPDGGAPAVRPPHAAADAESPGD